MVCNGPKASASRMLPVVMVTLYVISAVRASLSGIYVDNGLDRTVMQRSLTARERQEVEHEILNLLGLPNRPPSKRRSTHSGRNRVGGSAPQFLLGVYEALGDEGLQETPASLSLSGADIGAIDESDIIISFRSHGDPSWGHRTRKPWARLDAPLRHEKGRRLWFDVSEVSEEENIVGAELRLYRKAPRPVCPHLNHLYNLPYHIPDAFQVTAQQVVSKESIGVGGKEGVGSLQYLDSTKWSSDHEGWITLNVTSALETWVRNPKANLGLHISVRSLPSAGSHELHPEDVGIVGPPYGFNGKAPPSSREPFLVAFLGSSQLPVDSLHSRSKREVKRTGSGRKRKDHHESTTPYSIPNPFHEPAHWSTKSCQIRTLYVSFKNLEWQDWIIAPAGYNAFYCSGECNFPLNAHMNATNHAIVQTLVHLMYPLQYPKPCCAPTKLSPISVLYFLDDSNVILKKYKNMVVKSCGCH